MKRNIIHGLLALAVAFGLWLYVVTMVSPNSDNTYNGVSVVLQGESILEERGLMITTRQIPTISLRLEGNRSELQKLNSSNISVTVDVSKITEPGEHNLAINSNNIRFPGDVSNNAITVASRNPDYIKLEIKQRTNKLVPVEVLYHGAVPEGFIADKENAELDYESVEVSGPADVVDKIAEARVEMDLTDKNGTISENLTITLCDSEGHPVDAEMITTDTAQVNVTLKILRVKQIQLKLNVVDGGGATAETSTVTMDTETILVSGSDAILQNLDVLELGTVYLGEWLEDTTLVFPIDLPDGVGNETGIAEVIVQIGFPGLSTKTLDITNITAINVPEGKKAEIITKTLAVNFRGPAALIETLASEHVAVTVDFTEAQDGTSTMRAILTFTEEYAQIGEVGTYTVSATLK